MENLSCLRRLICIEQIRAGSAVILAIGKKVETVESQEKTNQIHLCRRCGRKLKSESSKERGMGESCFRRWIAEHGHKKLFSIPSLQTEEKSV